MLKKLLMSVGVVGALIVAVPGFVASAAVTTTTSASFFGATDEPGPGDPRVEYCGGTGQPACSGSEPVQVRWGQGVNGQSRLGFQPKGTATLGQPFELGLLTHGNVTINEYTGITAVQLAVTTHVNDSGRSLSFTDSLTMRLRIDEILDAQRPCPYGPSSGNCADAVLLPVPNESFVHTVGNVTYRLDVIGFQTGSGITQLIATPEFRTTTLPLMGVLTKVGQVVADAGPDQTVDEGSSVSLDGTASRVQDLTYSWVQTSGPAVVLDDPTAARPTFPIGLVTEDQVLEFLLTVRDSYEPEISSTDAVRVTVRDVNDPPAAVAGGPYTVPEGDSVTLGGVTTDPDGNIAAINWDFDGDGRYDDATGEAPSFSAAGLDGPSVVQVSMQVCDTFGVCATDATHVDVTNVAPTVRVGEDLTVYRNDPVTVFGTFTDPAAALDDPYGFAWSGGPTGATTYGETLPHATSYATEGVYTVGLTVTDKDGGSGDDAMTVTVLNRAPSCAGATPTVASLWPPNHQAVPVGIAGLTDAEGDELTVTVTGIRQDEPVHEIGSGNTGPDGTGVGTATAQLLPERSGRGDGRVYHVSFSVTDGHGGSCSGTVAVGVPHDQHGSDPVDQGPRYDSTVS
jgi:hypothetical protein